MSRHKPDDVHYGGKSPCWKHDGEPLDTSSWTACTCGDRVAGATAEAMVAAWYVHRAVDGPAREGLGLARRDFTIKPELRH